jgi:hypothetical protein
MTPRGSLNGVTIALKELTKKITRQDQRPGLEDMAFALMTDQLW